MSATPQSPPTRQSQILDAAAAVFAEKGYPRATVKEIAARANVAPGTIYLHFQNKRDLLLAIADQLIGHTIDQTLAQAADLPIDEYIAAIVRDRVAFARQNQALLRALVSEIWTDQELQRRFFTQIVTPLCATGARYLQEQVKNGKIRPCRVEIVAPVVAGAIIVLTAMRTLAPEYLLGDVSDQDLVTELTYLYIYGLQPRREEPGA